jgi:HCOMODA/2-hydroxy-3-carboxy-muconic semialdehyde decarboxylase
MAGRARSAWLGLIIACAALLTAEASSQERQMPAASPPGADAAVIDDIVVGSRVLAEQGVLDAFGHVSARDPKNPDHFLMSRSLAPALVSAG